MMMDRQIKGYLGEQRTAEIFLEYGWDVNAPLIESTEYDLHVRKGECHQYVQCKYRNVYRGAVQIENRRRRYRQNRVEEYDIQDRYNKKDIGIFSVYVPDIDKVLLIKSNEFDKTVSFRIKQNCRLTKAIRPATDYIEPEWLISGNLS